MCVGVRTQRKEQTRLLDCLTRLLPWIVVVRIDGLQIPRTLLIQQVAANYVRHVVPGHHVAMHGRPTLFAEEPSEGDLAHEVLADRTFLGAVVLAEYDVVQ